MGASAAGDERSWARVKRDGYLPIATLYTNVVNQRLALGVTFVAWRAGLTPNVLTVTSAILTALGGAIIVLCSPHARGDVTAAYLLLCAGYVLDSSDGQLARVAGLGSRLGAWLDHFVDGLKIVGINLCLGWCAVRSHGDAAILSLAYLATASNVFFQSAVFFGSKLKIANFGANLSRKLGTPRGRVRLMSIPFELLDWGVFILFVFVLPHPAAFLKLYLAYGIGCALLAVGYFAYSALQMWQVDHAPRVPEA